MHHDLAFVWPRSPWCQCLARGGLTYRSLLSNQNPLLWLTDCEWCSVSSRWCDWSSVAERTQKNKTKNITAKYITIKKQTKYGQSLNLWNWTMSHFSWFIVFCWRVTLQLSRCVFLMLKRHFFYPLPLFPDNSGRLELFTGHWQRREVK